MINQKWDIILKDEMQKEYFKQLGIFVKQEIFGVLKAQFPTNLV